MYKLVKDNSHKWLTFIVKDIFQMEGQESQLLVQTAWNYINDCYSTVCVTCFPPNVIAASCFQLALAMAKSKSNTNLPWWELVDVKLD